MSIITPPASAARTDSYVREDKPTQNFGNAQPLGVSGVNNKRWYALLGFAQPFENGVYVTSAILRLTRSAQNTVAFPIQVRRIKGKWQNLQVTWNNRPNVDDTDVVSFTVPAGPANTYVDIDVTSIMADVAAGGAYYGLEVRTTLTTANTTLFLHSRDNGNPLRSPTLQVAYSPAPGVPTQLVPNTLAFPAYPARFSWLVPAGSQSFYQVQVSNTPDFTAPAVDTGWLASDVPAHSFASNAEGYWRVRIRNAAGAESPWSQPAQTFLAAVPAVVIVQPANGSEAYDSPVWAQFTVTTTAPATKPTGYEAWVYDAETGEELGHLPRVSSPSLVSGQPIDIVIPGHLPTLGGEYRVQIMALDDITRAAGAGANPYGWAEGTFFLGTTTSATPLANPAASQMFVQQSQDPPRTLISWRGRDYIYKEYQVFFDDELVKVEPSTGLPGGPQGYVSHSYTDYGPRGQGTWSIHGVEETTAGGILADRLIVGAEVPAVKEIKVLGIWLVAPETEDQWAVQLLGQEPGSWDYSEDSSVFFPAGGPPTMITTNQRGYEGSIGGILTAPYAADAFRAIKAAAARGEEIRLIMSSFNFPILLGQVSLAPNPVDKEVWSCEFDFVQNGEFDSTWPT